MSKSTTGISDSETNCQISEIDKQKENVFAVAQKNAISNESSDSSKEWENSEVHVASFVDTNIHNWCTDTVKEASMQEQLSYCPDDDLMNFSEVELGAQMCCLYIDSLADTIESEQNVSSDMYFERAETNISSPSHIEHTEEEMINTSTDENNSHILNVTYVIRDKDDDQNYSNSYILNERQDSEEDILKSFKNINNNYVFDSDENDLPTLELGTPTEKSPHSINNDTINEKTVRPEEILISLGNIRNFTNDENYESISEISMPYETNSIQSVDKNNSYPEMRDISPIYDITSINDSGPSIFEADFITSVCAIIESGNFEVETPSSSGDDEKSSSSAESRKYSECNSLITDNTDEQSEDRKTPCQDLVRVSCSSPISPGHRTEFEILSETNYIKTPGEINLDEADDIQQACQGSQGATSNSASGNFGIGKKGKRSFHVRHRSNLVSRMRRGIGNRVHKMFGRGTSTTVQQEIDIEAAKKITKRHCLLNFINIVRKPRTLSRQGKKKINH